jgi:PBP superfamily domain
MKTSFLFFFTVIGGLLKNEGIAQSFYINATGGSFPTNVYQQATFAYQFLSSGDYVSYLGVGSTTGKCNIMGYWHVGDIATTQYPIPTSILMRDTLICTDACTVATCGISSITNPRFDSSSREPLIDFAGSDSLLTKADYDAFPDLQMFPALAGAVVAVYNIPELSSSANSSDRLTLSRQNIADIFKGEIIKWNDFRILKNNPSIRDSLARVTHDIKVVVRTDSSGTSEIFTTALSLFDPMISTPDYSFATRVTAGPTPKWCGTLTDEVQIIRISGCNFASPINGKLIQMRVIDGSYAVRNLSFACDASSGDLQTAFDSKPSGPGLIISVSKSLDSSGVATFRVGYSDPATARKFWYKPSLVSVPPGVTVNISTLQEGGYLNSHFNTTYFLTPLIESIWVSSAASFSYNVSWQSTTGKVYQVGLSTTSNRAAITKAFNVASAGSVTSVTASNYLSSTWTEYQITFSLAASADFSEFSVTPLLPANTGYVLITTLLDYKNYPVFYDYSHPRGYKGSGR